MLIFSRLRTDSDVALVAEALSELSFSKTVLRSGVGIVPWVWLSKEVLLQLDPLLLLQQNGFAVFAAACSSCWSWCSCCFFCVAFALALALAALALALTLLALAAPAAQPAPAATALPADLAGFTVALTTLTSAVATLASALAALAAVPTSGLAASFAAAFALAASFALTAAAPAHLIVESPQLEFWLIPKPQLVRIFGIPPCIAIF